MKKLAFLSLLALMAIAAALSSCGSNQILALPTSNISGNWEAQLTGGPGSVSGLNFLINFNLFVTNGSPTQNVNVNSFSWINSNSCFPPAPHVPTAQVNLTNNLNTGQITGSIVFTITNPKNNNVLTLSADPNATPPTGELIATTTSNNGVNGVVTNGGVNGSWWLTAGSGSANDPCNAGSATSPLPFIMCQNATKCTTALGPSISPRLF
jgi:predicted small lipoprotein YifL